MSQKLVVAPWCDAKHYDHLRSDGTPYASSTYCTCSQPPGHTDDHRCFGCARAWQNTAS